MKFLALWFVISLGLAATEAAEPVRIAAAADLKFALDEILGNFRQAHPEPDAQATYGSSGTLFAQIQNGAPFDLFLSADAKLPKLLVDGGQAVKGSAFTYAIGHVVVWVPKGSKLDLEGKGWEVLRDPAVRKIAVANPEVAPYGAAAVAALKTGGLYDAVKQRLVFGENVGQSAQFVESGAADAGFISRSLARAPKMQGTGRAWEIPAALYPRMEQGAVLCTRGANRAGAEALREYLRGAAGRAVLERYGFEVPQE